MAPVRSNTNSREAGSIPTAPEAPPPAPDGRGRASAAYTWGVILLGAIVAAVSVRALVLHPVGHEWLFLLGLTVASGMATLRVPGMPISFSISDIFSIASALLFGPSAGAVTAALDGLVLSLRMSTSRRSAPRIAFNASAPAIATWVAAQVFGLLAGPDPGAPGPLAALRLLASLTAFGALDYGLNTGLVAAAVSLDRAVSVAKVWRQHFSGLWLNYLGAVFGGMLVMLLARLHAADVIVLLTPLPVILYMAFRHSVGRTHDQIAHLGKVNRVYMGAIEALAQAVDAKDQVTHDHVRRVQTRSVELARALGVEDEAEVQAIRAASLLHDVGKLAIPEHILNKPGRLTAAEYQIMKRHAPIGADILSVIDFPYPVAPIVRHHHESWDGTGYPDGLAGDTIPIGARILSVVDCFDALTSDRPYRPRMEDAEALQVLADRKGTMYNPRVVDAFFAFQGLDAVPAPAAGSGTPARVQSPGASDPDASALHELRTFFTLGRAAGRADALAPTRLADLVWTHLGAHLPQAVLVVYLYVPDDDAIQAVCEAGALPSGLRPGSRLRLGDRLSGWVGATGETVVNSDARLDLDEAVRERSPLRSALSVPVRSDDRLIGVLSVYTCEVDGFAQSHRRLLVAAAHALASLPPEAVSIQSSPRGARRVS